MRETSAQVASLYVISQDQVMSRNDAALADSTSTHLAAYRAWLRAADQSPQTVDLRCYHLVRFARDIPRPLEATTDTLVAWLAARSWSTETRRSYRASLRAYYRWAHMVGLVDADPAAALPLIRPKVGIPRPAPEDTITAAREQAGERERLMIMLGAYAGLRRSEIAQVHSRDIVPDLGGWSLRVHGKGRRDRLVPLRAELARELRAQPAGWVFPSPAGGHLTPAHVGKLMSAALGPGVTSHQLRHRFATQAYAQGSDLYAVQLLLGHAKPETTEIYTQMPAGRARLIVDAMAA